MGRLPVPDLPPGPRRELSDALHELHLQAGRPSLRSLAASLGCSHTTVSALFSSPRLPTWGLLELLVETLHGDVDAFRRLWIAAGAADPSEGHRPTAPTAGGLVGRAEQVRAVLDTALVGDRVVLVSGEAGIGKSALLREATAALPPDVVAVHGSCLPRGRELTLLPLVSALRSTTGGSSWLHDALADCPDYVTEEVSRLLPELQSVTNQPPPPSDTLLQIRQLAAVAAVLAALNARRRMVLTLEDLQWADQTSLNVLDYLLALPNSFARIIATFRTNEHDVPDQVEDWRTRLTSLPRVTAVQLGPLSPSQTARQIAKLTGKDSDHDAASDIHRRSGGNPLFTELLVLNRESGRLPTRVAEQLDRRFDGLPADTWAICRGLATVERPISSTRLRHLVHQDHDTFNDALRQLRSRRLIRISDTTSDIEMGHPLLAESARDRILPTEAVREHARLARELERWDDVTAAEIAGHWQAAGKRHKELNWRIPAAHAAHMQHAYADEAQHWTRALELWQEDDEVVAGEDLLGACCAAMDAWEAAGEAQKAAQFANLAIAAVNDITPSDQAGDVYRRAGSLIGITDPAEGQRLLHTAISRYRELPVTSGQLQAMRQLAALYRGQGLYKEAGDLVAEAIQLSEPSDTSSLYRKLLVDDAWRLMQAGDTFRARQQIQAAVKVKPSPDDPSGDIWVGAVHTDILLKAGSDLADIEPASCAGLRAIAQWNITSFVASILISNVSQLLTRGGRVDRASAIVDPRTEQPVKLDTWAEHLERARLDLLRGNLDGSHRRLAELARLPITSLSFRAEIAATGAEWSLWNQQPAEALGRLDALLDEILPTAESKFAGALLALAARASADRAHQSEAAHADREAVAASLLTRLRNSAIDPHRATPIPYDAQAWARTWSAELARLTGANSLDLWASAVAGWDKLRRPHESSYCRWRLADAITASELGAVQQRGLLRRAVRDAAQHRPLLHAIELTAPVAGSRK